MTNPKNILVTTTSTLQGGLTIQQYLRPISTQIVAGAGFLKDFAASFTDLFGGRSDSYQKQLTSIYNEAIDRLKNHASDIGANCIVGLKIDMDEISGKGKEMFMITAIGTAVIIDGYDFESPLLKAEETMDFVSLEQLSLQKSKKKILATAEAGKLEYDDKTWDFITTNQVQEMFMYVVARFRQIVFANDYADSFNDKTFDFLNALPEDTASQLLHDAIATEENDTFAMKLTNLAGQLQLVDYDCIENLLQQPDFKMKKRALWLINNNKPSYNRQDLERLRTITALIAEKFKERGTRSMKKQMLSSKEKEVWACECGKTNDIDAVCTSCTKDIYGFKTNEINAVQTQAKLEERVELISDFLG